MQMPPVLLAAAAVLSQRALTRGSRPPTTGRTAGAAAVAVASAVVAGASARSFRRRGTTVDPLHPERASTLVTTGVNALTRNPMYLGMAGALTANAIRRGSWAAVVPVVGFVMAMDRLQIAPEESALREKFGAEYDEYRAAVPRWVGPRSLRLA